MKTSDIEHIILQQLLLMEKQLDFLMDETDAGTDTTETSFSLAPTLYAGIEKDDGIRHPASGIQHPATSFPMSSGQKRIFFIDQLDDEYNTYRITLAMRIKGNLDNKRLEQAFAETVRRHDALRTSFKMVNGELIQQVHDNVDFSVHYVQGAEGQEDDIIRNFIQFFDLEKPPLFRVCLATLPDNSYLLVFDTHHITVDGLSLGIIVQDFCRLYEGKPLSPQTKEYRDFITWEQAMMQSEVLKQHQAYWQKKFSGDIPVLNLPTDYPRPLDRSPMGNILYSYLPEDKTDLLKALAREAGFTLPITLLAAYIVLLHRLTGQEDIVVGMPVGGRPPDFEDVVGMFANTLALRNYPKGDQTFKDLLDQVKINFLEDYNHQEYPFELLVDSLDIERDTSRNALFDAMFTYEKAEDRVFRIKDLDFSSYDIKLDTAIFDFDLEAVEQEGVLYLTLAYTKDIFKQETIERWFRYYETILHEIIRDPNRQLTEIDIMSHEERHQLLVEFNDTDVSFPQDKTTVDLFEEQAGKTPGNTAVIYEDVRLTYQELNEQANRIAHYLRDIHNIQPEDRVGLLLERSEWIVAGILGILKAGGAYVPADLFYPPDRIRHILQNSKCRLLLTEEKHLGMAQSFSDADIPVFDIRQIQGDKTSDPVPCTGPRNLVYVIYTSGSTGAPKGVMIEHRSLVNLTYAYRRAYGLGEFDVRLLQMASMSFDIFFADMLRTLTIGGQLIICPADTRIDLPLLYSLIAEHRITIFESTPGLILPLMDYIFENNLDISFLKVLISSSDSLQAEHYRTMVRRFPKLRIINGYGMTEGTIDSSYFDDRDFDTPPGAITLIAKPLFQNAKYYILDPGCRLLPVGVPGEIHVGGVYAARGYLDNKTLTNERFIPNPFDPGDRLYKTGDGARWLSDGNMEFLGRIDNQVQIRGFRIELEEIENRLLQHESIGKVLVLARDTDDGTKELVAYLVGADGADSDLTVSELRTYLGQFLPDYMIPAWFVFLKEFPLTPNDKIDRKALPVPDISERLSAEYTAPRSEMEKNFAMIWEDILERSSVGIYDNFFELGGQSIKAIRLISKLNTELGISVKLQDIFKTPTIAELAAKNRLSSDPVMAPSQGMDDDLKQKRDSVIFPSSSAQKRLYFLTQLENGDVAYQQVGAVFIEGNPDIGKLEYCFKLLVQRHESLRTGIVMQNDEIQQVIWRDVHFGLIRKEISGDNLQTFLQDLIQPFDLSEPPLMRGWLVQVSLNSYLLLISAHHIISDGMSLNVLFQEFMELYKGKTLPPPKGQYQDYVLWEQEYLRSHAIKADEKFWLDKSWDEISVLNLPTDYPRPPIQNFEGQNVSFKLGKHHTKILKEEAKKLNVSFFMLLFAAYYVLLHKLTSQDDIVIGIPASGRDIVNFETTVGMFAKTLPIRIRIQGDECFSDLLEVVKENLSASYNHQNYPFQVLVEKLDVKRDISRNPLFDTMFVYENADDRVIEIENLTCTPHDFKPNTSIFDLTLEAILAEEEVSLRFEYNTKLFKKERVERLPEYYKNILKAILTDSQIHLHSIDFLPESEKHKLLVEWNDTKTDYPKDKCIHQLFEEQVEKIPGSTAVVFENEKLTYKEFNKRANQLAHYLQSLGVGPEVFVCICMERSIDMVTALFAVIKAGGAYIPIDTDYPEERVKFMIEDSNGRVILTQHKFAGFLSDIDADIIFTDTRDDMFSEYPVGNPGADLKPENAAYMIYTSGSTGKPKGVINTHAGILNRILWMQDAFELTPQDPVMQKTPFSFDVSVWEFLWTLAAGASLIVAKPGGHKDPDYLAELIQQWKITTLHFVPSMLSAFLEASDINKCGSVRQVICSGEALPYELQKRFFDKFHCKLHNLYGPTEAAVDVTYWECRKNDKSSIVPIGKPIANTKLYILNENLKPVPTGVSGELHIGGIQVARGYHNRPELSAEKFISDPFIDDTESRLYKTGDLCRYLPDGNIEFLGRIDHQVKIRGFRIEPGEIEVLLNRHSSIREAVVVVREDYPGDQRIVAYFAPQDGKEQDIYELRKYLNDKLPDYMVPAHFIPIRQFKLTPNGKIDRKVLPQPDKTEMLSDSEYEAPCNYLEKSFVRIWEEILQIKPIGIRNNFFELGGHSINALRLVSKIQAELGISVKLQDILKTPTIAELADKAKLSADPVFAPIQPLAEQEYYELSSTQKGLWLIDQMDKDSIANNMHGAFLLEGELDADAFEEAVKRVTVRHESFRTVFITVKGEPRQKILDKSGFYLERIDLSNEKDPEEQAYAYYMKEADTPFDLEKGPLFRMKLLKLNNPNQVSSFKFQVSKKYVLISNIHHIIYDGWTDEIMFKEISEMYSACLQGKYPELPPLRIHYKDYAAWMNHLETGDAMKPHREYWLNKLSGDLPVLSFPLDFPRPDIQRFKGKYAPFSIDRGLTEDIRRLTASHRATLFMTLVSSVSTLLYCYTLQEDIIVGVPATGRVHPDLEDQVGCYLNMIPLRNIFDREDTLKTVLEKARETATEAYEHEIYPHNRLVQDLNLQKDMSRNYLFDIIVNVVSFESSSLELDNVRISPFAEDTTTSRADLNFMFQTGEELQFTIEYDTDLFKEETIQKIGNDTIEILKAFVNNTDMTLNQAQEMFVTSEQKKEEEGFLESITDIEEDF